MKYLSVCSGIEAATVAWHSLGWEPQAFSEIEKFPSQVLKHHYPNVPNLGDMTKFEEWNLGTIDVVVGGTPCQSFSVAGLRKGLADPRGNLALVYCGILDRFKPKWFVWENVPGVLSSNGGRDFGSFLGAVAELGYGWAYRVLDAQYFGVAQRRRRVFVVGHFGDYQRAAAVLFEPESLRGDSPPSRKARQSVAGTIGSRASSGGGFSTDFECAGGLQPVAVRMVAFGEYVDDGTASAMKARDYKDATDLVAHTLRGEGFDASEDGTGRGTPLVPIAYSMITANTGSNGLGVSAEIAPTLDRAQPAAIAQPVSAFKYTMGSKAHGIGYAEEQTPTLDTKQNSIAVAQPIAFAQNTRDEVRLINGDGSIVGALAAEPGMKQTSYVAQPIGFNARQDPSSSIERVGAIDTDSGTQAVMQSMAVRRLTPIECERLQGFPDNYTNIPKAADGPRYKALGNSMAVPVMHWIGKRIQEVDATRRADER